MPGGGEKGDGRAEYRRRKEQEASGCWVPPQNQHVFSGSSRGQQPPVGAGVTGSSCRGYGLERHPLCPSQNLPAGTGLPQTPAAAAGLTTEMLASPIEGVAPALHTASSPWHTDMAAVRLDGRVAPLMSVKPLPQAAAATSQKKVKETVTQKSWEEQRDRKCTQKGPPDGLLLFLWP